MFIEILFSSLYIPTVRDQTKKIIPFLFFLFSPIAHCECILGINLKKKKKEKQSIHQSFRSTSLTSTVICHFHCRRVLTSAPCAELRLFFSFFSLIPCSLPSLPRAFSVCPSDLRIQRGELLGCAGFILSNRDKDEPLVFQTWGLDHASAADRTNYWMYFIPQSASEFKYAVLQYL